MFGRNDNILRSFNKIKENPTLTEQDYHVALFLFNLECYLKSKKKDNGSAPQKCPKETVYPEEYEWDDYKKLAIYCLDANK